MLKSYIEKINKSQILYAYWLKITINYAVTSVHIICTNVKLAFVVIFIQQYWRTQKRTTCKKAFAGSRTTRIEII